jgi:3-deoxy-D-manno-octulosonic acid hydroxylase-like protein
MLHTVKPEEASHLLAEALELGQVVQFSRCPVALPSEEEQRFLREDLAPWLRKKNVSYYPEAGKLTGMKAPAAVLKRAESILREHSLRVQAYLTRAMPEFTAGWQPGTSSFRPLEEQGRGLDAHASNELIHVDAGAYGATHGDRILRFFINLNPTRERVWISKGPFAGLLQEHGARAGVVGGDLRPAVPERAFSFALRAARGVFPMARVVDTSPYDRRMRRFHNWMKDTPQFQAPPHQRFSFAPFTAWMVLTDGVSHACISGQHALVDTFLIPLRNCKLPAPFQLLAAKPEPGRSATAPRSGDS